MKCIFLVIPVCLFCLVGFAQNNPEYEVLTAKASLCHLQKKPREAIRYFESAFLLQSPDALNAYKAAGVYALDSNQQKAFEYINLAIDKGWTEADWLANDPYFDYLKSSNPAGWKTTLQKAYDREQQYEKKLKLPAVRRKINRLTLKDQQLRYLRIQNESSSKADSIETAIAAADKQNLEEAKKIIRQYGWPAISSIGKDGANNLWLIVQHADQDILFQRQVLALMTRMKNSQALNLENYAFLYDRVQCSLNYRQYYGTQVKWAGHGTANGFRPITKENEVDNRRAALGLYSLKVYALTYGFDYQLPSAQEASQQEASDEKLVQQLMDSAAYYYKWNDFANVYNAYNSASEIQGGMSNADNYTAALQCAKIAAITREQQYKDIALDFLTLLYKRGGLQKQKLVNEKDFAILRKERRWLFIQKW